jgi:hypothetical protein
MLTGELRNQVDAIWNSFWSGGISNPLEVMEQITYLLFLRRLDELHTLEELKGSDPFRLYAAFGDIPILRVYTCRVLEQTSSNSEGGIIQSASLHFALRAPAADAIAPGDCSNRGHKGTPSATRLNKKASAREAFLFNGGEGGIRTLDTG